MTRTVDFTRNLPARVLPFHLTKIFENRCMRIHQIKRANSDRRRKQLFGVAIRSMIQGSILVNSTLFRLNLSYPGNNLKYKVYRAPTSENAYIFLVKIKKAGQLCETRYFRVRVN